MKVTRQSVFDMRVSKVYPLLLQKVERKGRSKEELDTVIEWLTGYDMKQVDQEMTYGDFFRHAPAMNPRAELIKGKVCGVQVETIVDPMMKRVRQLDTAQGETPASEGIDCGAAARQSR